MARKHYLCAAALWLTVSPMALAAVSPQEAEQLKTTLTPLGGQRAGSADKLVPAWTGGYTTVPPGFVSGDKRTDPYAAEKPLYSITAATMGAHADMLSDGQKALLKRYPDYAIDVYTTHRTAAAPQAVYDATFKNATTATVAADGNSLSGAYGGTPFPIPKSGVEVIWNHILRWHGESISYPFRGYLVDSTGRITLASEVTQAVSFPYYFVGQEAKFDGTYFDLNQATTAPAFKSGGVILLRDKIAAGGSARQAWQYLVGQRRVRRAPSLQFDTPNPVTSGVDFFDEPAGLLGSLEKFSYKLVGEREMIVPYNVNGMYARPAHDQMKAGHLVGIRHEVHRVWVIDATLRPSERHVIPHKIFYIDEDSWAVLLVDGWDASGQLYHHTEVLSAIMPEYPMTTGPSYTTFDFQKNSYSFTTDVDNEGQFKKVPIWPAETFTPEFVAARGVR